jgi:hypothetical protein
MAQTGAMIRLFYIPDFLKFNKNHTMFQTGTSTGPGMYNYCKQGRFMPKQ